MQRKDMQARDRQGSMDRGGGMEGYPPTGHPRCRVAGDLCLALHAVAEGGLVGHGIRMHGHGGYGRRVARVTKEQYLPPRDESLEALGAKGQQEGP